MKRAISDSSGASLVMVIVFVMVFSLLTATLLEFAGTGLRTTSAYSDLSEEHLFVDAAMEGAINAIRSSGTAGLEGEPCPDFTYAAPTGSDLTDVIVTCTSDGDSALDGGLEDILPKYAILTLGTGSCQGLELAGGQELAVSGGVYSNSRIAVNDRVNAGCPTVSGGGAAIHVFGDVHARNNWCFEAGVSITATSDLDCNYPDIEPTPPYLPAAASITGLAVDPAATCSTTTGIVVFSPGLYTEVPNNHYDRAVTSAGLPCVGTLWWFQPGVYYFDFPVTDDEWEINPYNVVGGTPIGSSWSATSSPAAVPVKAACESPGTTDTPAPGVQFIFGGTSRISTQGTAAATTTGILELCAGADPTGNQRIAVFGLKSAQPNVRLAVTGDAQRRLATTATIGASDGTWTATGAPPASSPAEAARVIDTGGQALAVLTAAGQKAAQIRYEVFEDVTPGSLTENVFVDVRHEESGTTSKVALTLLLKFDKGTAACPGTSTLVSGKCTEAVGIPVLTSMGTASFDVTSRLRSIFRYADVNSVSADLVVDGSTLAVLPATRLPSHPSCPSNPACSPTTETATVTIDGVRLRAAHTTPGFRPHCSPVSGSTCASTTVLNPLLHTTTNPVAIFRGLFFAPNSDIEVNVHSAGETVFERGLVVRSLAGNASTSSQQDTSPFSIPGLVARRVVIFEAELDGVVRLRARVAYDDSDYAGQAVDVQDWVVVR